MENRTFEEWLLWDNGDAALDQSLRQELLSSDFTAPHHGRFMTGQLSGVTYALLGQPEDSRWYFEQALRWGWPWDTPVPPRGWDPYTKVMGVHDCRDAVLLQGETLCVAAILGEMDRARQIAHLIPPNAQAAMNYLRDYPDTWWESRIMMWLAIAYLITGAVSLAETANVLNHARDAFHRGGTRNMAEDGRYVVPFLKEVLAHRQDGRTGPLPFEKLTASDDYGLRRIGWFYRLAFEKLFAQPDTHSVRSER